MRHFVAFVIAMLTAVPAAAQEDATFRLGGDLFAAGRVVEHTSEGDDNLFLAGETVRQDSAISGTAHLAGRRVTVAARVGGNLYGAGMEVAANAEVNGDATLAGYDVSVTAPVGGTLRASGSRVALTAPVGGHAMLGGEHVEINGEIGGDAAIAAETLSFGPDARIGGTLRLYAKDPDSIEVPDSVIPADRVTRLQRAEWTGPRRPEIVAVSWTGMILSFIGGVIVVALIAALLAAVAPEYLADMRRRVLARPFATLGYGFLTLSALTGAAILLAVTIVGIFLSPAALLIAALAAFAGYIVGTYSFGAGLLIAAGQGEPASLRQRAAAAFVGALVVGLLALIPLLGWIFVMALSLAGVGAITLKTLRPAFFAK